MSKNLTTNNLDKTYNIKVITMSCNYAFVSYSSGGRGYLIHKDEKGYYICDENKKRYFDTQMNMDLDLQGINGASEELEKEILKFR